MNDKNDPMDTAEQAHAAIVKQKAAEAEAAERQKDIDSIVALIADFDRTDDLMPIVRVILEKNHMVACIWSPEDLDEMLEAYPADKREELKEAALATSYWESLGDADESSWFTIQMAVEDAASKLGIKPSSRLAADEEN